MSIKDIARLTGLTMTDVYQTRALLKSPRSWLSEERIEQKLPNHQYGELIEECLRITSEQNNRNFTIASLYHQLEKGNHQYRLPSKTIVYQIVKRCLGKRWRKVSIRPDSILKRDHVENVRDVAKLYSSLNRLGYCIFAMDEFSVDVRCSKPYMWCQKDKQNNIIT